MKKNHLNRRTGVDFVGEDRIAINLAKIDAISLKGKRPVDEDFIIAEDLSNGVQVTVLLDGVGGGAKGEVASEAAGRAFVESVELSNLSASKSLEDSLKRCIRAANMAVEKISAESQLRSGTTITAIVAKRGDDDSIEWAKLVHIGDSRAYRVRGGIAELLSEDHSMTGEMVRAGYIQLHEIEETHGKNVLTMCLGGPAELNPQIESIELSQGDVVMLCCDGVWGPLHTEEGMWIGSLNAEELAKEALDRGSTDNCSVLLWEI